MREDKKTIILKAVFCIILLIICIVWIRGLFYAYKQPTYKTWFNIGEPSEYYFEVKDLNQRIVQQFDAPCDEVFEKVAVRIATYSGQSKSQWKVELFEGDKDTLLYEGTFDSQKVKDNTYFNVINKEIKVSKDSSYKLMITPLNIQGEFGLAFYADEEGKRGYLSGGDSEERFDLDIKVYGSSDGNFFWAGSYIAVSLFALLIFIRILFLQKRQMSWIQDPLIQTMVLMLIYFFLHTGCLDIYEFTDENDNIRGGIIVADGGVIYKDYVTQHMPFMYYLCAIFSKLGASSIPQFRVLYYMFCSLFAGLIYLRNGAKFGKCRIALFLIWEPFVLYMIHSSYPLRILSDNVQTMAMVVLLLEYLNYRKKPGVGIKRSIIVSLAIFISLGCAFLSAYPIAVIGVSVIINEATYVKKKQRRHKRRRPISYYIKRYRKLVLICLFPFILCAVYFSINRALPMAYEMAYRFNIDVYEKYTNIGGSKIGIIFLGIRNFFTTITQDMVNLFQKFEAVSIVRILILLAVVFGVGKELWKRHYLTGITIFLFLCMCNTRDPSSNHFHVIAFWGIAMLIAVLYVDWKNITIITGIWRKVVAASAVLAVSLLIYEPYGSTLLDSFFSEHTVELKEWEQYVVDHTKEGDKILIDSYCYESVYLVDKGRYSITRVPYFLPWYMDWYQEEIIEVLQEQKPSMVLYNPKIEVWEISGFLEPLKKQVNKDYDQDKITGIYIRK